MNFLIKTSPGEFLDKLTILEIKSERIQAPAKLENINHELDHLRSVWNSSPVARTDVGNIAMSAVQFEPELFRCMAFKGAEIICRVATGGFEFDDMRLTSYQNSLYTMVTNNSVSTHGRHPGFFEDESYACFEAVLDGIALTRIAKLPRHADVVEQSVGPFEFELGSLGSRQCPLHGLILFA